MNSSDQGMEQAFGLLKDGLRSKIRAHELRLSKVRHDIEQLRDEEAHCVREIAEMENAIAVFQSAFGLGDQAATTDGVDAHRYRSQTVAQSAYDIMQSRGGRARVVEILRLLRDVGKLKSYESGYSTIKKTLDRDKRFVKVKPGVYAIAEEESGARSADTNP